MTFTNYGTPVCRTTRRQSQRMYLQEFWDSCAQNKKPDISNQALSEILGLLCAEQNVGNLKNCTFINSGTPVRRGGRPSAASPPSVVSFLLALNKAHVLALNTAHVLRLNKADVLALNKAHALRLNPKICPVLTANTKEAASGRLHKGGGPSAAPPLWFALCWLLGIS